MGVSNKTYKVIFFICFVILPIITGFLIYGHRKETFVGAWVKYNLVDGLWVFSFSIFLLYIWGQEKKSLMKTFWLLTPMLSAIGFEFSQFVFSWGTFDVLDIIWYCLGYSFSFLIFLSFFNKSFCNIKSKLKGIKNRIKYNKSCFCKFKWLML